MAKVLTAAAIERLKPGNERREIRDGGCPGLYLIIQSSGVKSWAMRFRKPGGRSAKLTLGKANPVKEEADSEPVVGMPLTLASARRLATELHRQRAMGKDVIAIRHREKLELATRGSKTFDRAVIDFVTQHCMRKTRRWQERARLLGVRPVADGEELELIPKGLSDRWRDRAITDIDADDVHAIIDECREKGVPGLEKRIAGPSEPRALVMFASLSKLFSWLVERRRVAGNPCREIKRPATQQARDRVLTSDEIVKFWKAASAERREFAAVLKLLLLTGQRRNEVAGMRRAELSKNSALWTIPGERTKNKRAHVVPLPELARGIIENSTVVNGETVFTTNGGAPVFIGSKIKNRLDAAMQIEPWRVHDLRRTCATGMAELGIPPHIVEAVLNHVSGAKAGVAGVYNRAAYSPEKKAALEVWAAHVEGLVTG